MSENKYGEILSYRPNIRQAQNKTSVSVSSYVDENNILNDYYDNVPSNNLVRFSNVLQQSREILKKLEETFIETRYNNYTFSQYCGFVNDGKESSVNEIYNSASNDIESDIVVETYKRLNDESVQVSDFVNMYKKINYGNDDISIKEAQTVDISSMDNVHNYSTNDFKKINYASLNFESKLNKIVELRLELSSIYINTLGSTALASHTEKIDNYETELKLGAKLLFEEINDEYKVVSREFDKINSLDTFSIVYEHICISLSEYYEMLSINKALFENPVSLTCTEIGKHLDKKADEIDYYLIELYKMVAKCSIYIDKYSEVLRKKDEIKLYHNS